MPVYIRFEVDIVNKILAQFIEYSQLKTRIENIIWNNSNNNIEELDPATMINLKEAIKEFKKMRNGPIKAMENIDVDKVIINDWFTFNDKGMNLLRKMNNNVELNKFKDIFESEWETFKDFLVENLKFSEEILDKNKNWLKRIFSYLEFCSIN